MAVGDGPSYIVMAVDDGPEKKVMAVDDGPSATLAKRCCSGESDEIASLNSFGVGIVSSISGIVSSSLFCVWTCV